MLVYKGEYRMVSCIPTLKVAQNEKEKNQLGGSGSLFSVAAFRRDSIYACSVPFKRTSGIAAAGTGGGTLRFLIWPDFRG